MSTRNFQQELGEARPKAERLEALLHTWGIEHDPIDWQHAGMLALVKSNGVHLGGLIELGEMEERTLLEQIQRDKAKEVARQALGIEHGGHLIHVTSLIAPAACTASWMAEIWFDADESRYALVGEYIIPTTDTPVGWKRDYRIYQVKADAQCDVQGCETHWHERRETSYGYCVHLCHRHQGERADAVYARAHPVIAKEGSANG
jgi:hypothetical protein